MNLYGASGHCKVVIDAIKKSENLKIDAIFDDNPVVESILGISIIKPNNDNLQSINDVIVTIGDNLSRKKVVGKLQTNFLKIVHKNAIVSDFAAIGDGSVVFAGAIINASAVVGQHCIINSGAVVEHDCQISDFVHISPNASLAGNVSIAEGAHIGIGAIVLQGVAVGKWATIGAGAVVLKNIPDYAVAVGNPARIIKTKDNF